MNADNDYKIGYQHIVCEDYSLSGVRADGSGAFAIVSDGCSASPDVDVGARILAMSARELLTKMEFFNKDGLIGYIDFGTQIIQRANTIPPLFPAMNTGALDATLLVAWVDKDKLRVYMYGDGVFLHKHKNGIDGVHVSFDNNAPSYLSYWLDSKRMEGYLKMDGKKEVISNLIVDGKEVATSPNSVLPFEDVKFEKTVEPGDVIALCSDGINSFRSAESNSIPWQDLVGDYIGFKNFEGVFVKRQFAGFKRKCQKEGVTHFDDISIAAIII